MIGSDIHAKGFHTIAKMLSDAGIDDALAGERLLALNRREPLVMTANISRVEYETWRAAGVCWRE